MKNLANQKCIPCEGGMPPMSDDGIVNNLARLKGWRREQSSITKNYQRKNFSDALLLVNKVGELAEIEGHHPDILLHSYKKIRITLSTHAVKGLSVNDFILAAKIDEIAG